VSLARLKRLEALAEAAMVAELAEDIRAACPDRSIDAREAALEAVRIARRHALRGCCDGASEERRRACLDAQYGSPPPDDGEWHRRLLAAREERRRRRRGEA
jgi:hypothetical protein